MADEGAPRRSRGRSWSTGRSSGGARPSSPGSVERLSCRHATAMMREAKVLREAQDQQDQQEQQHQEERELYEQQQQQLHCGTQEELLASQVSNGSSDGCDARSSLRGQIRATFLVALSWKRWLAAVNRTRAAGSFAKLLAAIFRRPLVLALAILKQHLLSIAVEKAVDSRWPSRERVSWCENVEFAEEGVADSCPEADVAHDDNDEETSSLCHRSRQRRRSRPGVATWMYEEPENDADSATHRAAARLLHMVLRAPTTRCLLGSLSIWRASATALSERSLADAERHELEAACSEAEAAESRALAEARIEREMRQVEEQRRVAAELAAAQAEAAATARAETDMTVEGSVSAAVQPPVCTPVATAEGGGTRRQRCAKSPAACRRLVGAGLMQKSAHSSDVHPSASASQTVSLVSEAATLVAASAAASAAAASAEAAMAKAARQVCRAVARAVKRQQEVSACHAFCAIRVNAFAVEAWHLQRALDTERSERETLAHEVHELTAADMEVSAELARAVDDARFRTRRWAVSAAAAHIGYGVRRRLEAAFGRLRLAATIHAVASTRNLDARKCYADSPRRSGFSCVNCSGGRSMAELEEAMAETARRACDEALQRAAAAARPPEVVARALPETWPTSNSNKSIDFEGAHGMDTAKLAQWVAHRADNVLRLKARLCLHHDFASRVRSVPPLPGRRFGMTMVRASPPPPLASPVSPPTPLQSGLASMSTAASLSGVSGAVAASLTAAASEESGVASRSPSCSATEIRLSGHDTAALEALAIRLTRGGACLMEYILASLVRSRLRTGLNGLLAACQVSGNAAKRDDKKPCKLIGNGVGSSAGHMRSLTRRSSGSGSGGSGGGFGRAGASAWQSTSHVRGHQEQPRPRARSAGCIIR
eukprot:TRINITY_DN67605_c0_g1_i1.p1 TRINITY_DN67605_c0_g1~~TRINITY_DN67605_c0_g1_i1.p1  ORF type:complete len:888 (-),score=139.71 TRINITY_DN67605_c0_g1_i1:504-3167(-)